jgi:PTH1 family peptidyl-tRNA hydrolase
MKKLIVGLGNPGNKYKKTRHNAGFMATDYLADQFSTQRFAKSGNADALATDAVIQGRKTKLVKPQTFMNKSGQAVRDLANYYSIPSEDILIVHDDIDLPLGSLRISFDSTAGGHNGVQSVIDELQTKAFVRLRVGVAPTDKEGRARKPKNISTRDYVLQRFESAEQERLADIFAANLQGVIEVWVTEGGEAAMNEYN